MSDDPTTIHPFPELRAYAEEDAESAYSAMVAYSVTYPYDVHGRKRSEADPWEQLPNGTREWWIGARLLLLCDLSRPASRDAVARLVAKRVGVECGATAPSLYWMPGQPGSRDRDGAPECDDWPPGWWLSNDLGGLLFFTGADWCPDDHTEIAGLPDGNERATEALALIVRHLWPPESTDAR